MKKINTESFIYELVLEGLGLGAVAYTWKTANKMVDHFERKSNFTFGMGIRLLIYAVSLGAQRLVINDAKDFVDGYNILVDVFNERH